MAIVSSFLGLCRQDLHPLNGSTSNRAIDMREIQLSGATLLPLELVLQQGGVNANQPQALLALEIAGQDTRKLFLSAAVNKAFVSQGAGVVVLLVSELAPVLFGGHVKELGGILCCLGVVRHSVCEHESVKKCSRRFRNFHTIMTGYS